MAGYPTVYFDAWHNDFTSEPLVGFIAEINEALKPQFNRYPQAKRLLSTAIGSAKKMIKPAVTTTAEIVFQRLTHLSINELKLIWDAHQYGVDAAANDASREGDHTQPGNESSQGNIRKEIGTIMAKCADAALKEHTSTKTAIATFKKNLSKLVDFLDTHGAIKLPLFIFVDELDRCRPTYAIELLKNIKHLFGVKDVYFVIATNVRQLSHGVRVIYGDNFESERYLKRFFDQEYVLPLPDNEKFAIHLFDKYGLTKESRLYTGLPEDLYSNDSGTKPDLAALLFAKFAAAFKLGLRDQEQIAAILKAVILIWKQKIIQAAYLYFLLMLRHSDSAAYDRLVNSAGKVNKGAIDLAKFLDPTVKIKAHPRPSSSHPYLRDRTPRDVSLADIVSLYLENANANLLKVREKNINVYDFPNSLLSKLIEEAPNPYDPDKFYPSSLEDYPQIVAQAGQLIA